MATSSQQGEVACIQCQSLFEPDEPEQIFCSRECYYESQRLEPHEREYVTSTCPWCGKEFQHYPSVYRKYCSRRCANKAIFGDGEPGDWRELYDIVDHPTNGRGPIIYAALRDAGFVTVDDIRDADPTEVNDVQGVGPSTLRRLTIYIDGFDASEFFEDHDREATKVKRCPACQRDLEPGEVHDHIFNCPEV